MSPLTIDDRHPEPAISRKTALQRPQPPSAATVTPSPATTRDLVRATTRRPRASEAHEHGSLVPVERRSDRRQRGPALLGARPWWTPGWIG